MDADHERDHVMATPNKNAPVGGGGRFAALKQDLAKKPGVTDPGALAASIGAKKYGRAKMQSMAKSGKKGG
jgi:hypothetical protein